MDALIGNLKTHEMNRNQDTSKKEAKKDKSLVLKIKSRDDSSEEDDMVYLTKRFQKILKNKEYQRPGDEKDKRRDLVLEKIARKAAADYVVKKALAVSVVGHDKHHESEESECPADASMLVVQDDANIFDGMFAFMAKSDDEDDEEKVTLFDLKKNLNTYSIRRLRNLAVTEEQVMVLESENLELKEQLSLMIEKSGKRKGEVTSLQAELEASLNMAESRLALALERNDHMERDMSKWPFEKGLSCLENLSRKVFRGEGSSSQCWFMDSGCSKHMTRSTKSFISLKALQGRGVSFGDGKKGHILGVGRVGKSLEDSIENVYYVSGLKYNLLSVSQICDKGSEVKFSSDKCIVTSLTNKKLILMARRRKNMYVVDLETPHGDDLTYLSAQSENDVLWHRRLGHVSSSLLNKLVSRDLVRGLPKLKFSDVK
ncbi:uncharacterized protein LOC125825454 [Solanum verrucosum]|uniref:uncharacterized protein LOC125825454 n=1 Tax=Solanum verrucosum TaxID=315347 RepID=UPI0020D0A7E0|nr:uncharacterized protein LOC125825454 [Solanum verrucosum]